ncbi:MAG: Relaxase/mobilization nuclease [Actinomycetia bacterium]|nr:Relaxase/mobilization nuclease [Actinomycetes bacterium]
MIGRVLKSGKRVRGLLYYLYRDSSKHVNPRIVAGWRDPARVEPPVKPNGRRDFRRLAELLEAPLALLDDRAPQRPVWHCTLSVAPDDPDLGDGAMAAIAEEVMHRTGLHERGREDQGVPWVAVRHADNHNHIHTGRASWVAILTALILLASAIARLREQQQRAPGEGSPRRGGRPVGGHHRSGPNARSGNHQDRTATQAQPSRSQEQWPGRAPEAVNSPGEFVSKPGEGSQPSCIPIPGQDEMHVMAWRVHGRVAGLSRSPAIMRAWPAFWSSSSALIGPGQVMTSWSPASCQSGRSLVR